MYDDGKKNYVDLLDSNVRLGLSILQSAIVAGYGEVAFININTALDPSLNFYTLTKKQFSNFALQISREQKSDLKIIDLQLQHMYGPHDNDGRFVTNLLRSCSRNEYEIKLTQGDQLRDFIYIDDVVDALEVIVKNVKDFEPNFVNIEIGSGHGVSIRSVVEIAHRLTSSKTKLSFGKVNYRDGEPMNMRANIELLLALGWKPKYEIESGLKRIIEIEALST
jgi:nucleoside-diphosphate-sugar epimerase